MIDLFQWISYGLVWIVLIYIAVKDIRIKKISNSSLAVLLAVGILATYALPISISERGAGVLLVGGILLLIDLILPGAFGGGDIKLLAIAGGLLGWRGGLWALCAAFITGGIYSSLMLLVGKMKRKDKFAFGPFICMGIAFCFVFVNS